ncbi:MAG: YicC/YloC family endoribonuclease, partial [Planctomycetota bacterium]
MIRSMTGFGVATAHIEGYHVEARIRTVNSKDLKPSFNLPPALRLKEAEVEKLVKNRLNRGRVFVDVDCEIDTQDIAVLVDWDKLDTYVRIIRELAAEKGLNPDVDLASLLSISDALREEPEELPDGVWDALMDVCSQALDSVIEMRTEEGANLREQIEELCDSMDESLDRVEEAAPNLVEEYRDRLRSRVEDLMEGMDLDEDNRSIAREVAIYADKCDVSEEIARLRSHISQMRDILESAESPAGRKLDFLAQEMLRESDTMAAKIPG